MPAILNLLSLQAGPACRRGWHRFRHSVGAVAAKFVLTQPKTSNALQLSWTGNGFLLESAAAITGPWLTFPNQLNPQSVLIEAGERFFRLRLP